MTFALSLPDVSASGPTVTALQPSCDDCSPTLAPSETSESEPESALDRLPLGGHSLQTIERAAIRQTLLAVRGNKVQAARALGIAPSTLYEKLRKYGL